MNADDDNTDAVAEEDDAMDEDDEEDDEDDEDEASECGAARNTEPRSVAAIGRRAARACSIADRRERKPAS